MVRIKRRFLIFQILVKPENSSFAPGASDILHALSKPFQIMYGDFGAGSVFPSLKMIVYDSNRRIGVLRLPRDWSERYKSFLLEQTDLLDTEVRFKVPHMSGTVDQAQTWLEQNSSAFD